MESLKFDRDGVLGRAGRISQRTAGHEFIDSGGPSLHGRGLLFGPLHCQADIAEFLRDAGYCLIDLGLGLGSGVRGLDGFLARPEGVDLGLQLLRGLHQLLFLRRQVSVLTLQICLLLRQQGFPAERFAGQVFAVIAQGGARLAVEGGLLLVDLGYLQLQPLTRRGDIGDPAANFLKQFKLLLVRVIERLARIFSPVKGTVRLALEDEREALPQTHADPLTLVSPGVLVGRLRGAAGIVRRWPDSPACSPDYAERMFGRRTKTASSATSTSESEAAATGNDATERDATAPKGRPTPSRKEAEAARKQALRVPKDPKQAKAAERERARESRLRQAEALRGGDERYLPARDQGPAKKFVREWVDTRFQLQSYFLVLALVILLSGPIQRIFKLTTVAMANIRAIETALLLAMLITTAGTYFIIGRAVRRQFPDPVDNKGAALYGMLRSAMPRRMRQPRPVVGFRGKPVAPKAPKEPK